MIKRIISLILAVFIFWGYTGIPAVSQTKPAKQESNYYENLVPKKLELEMKDAIAHIYGKENVDSIYGNIELMIKQAKFARRPDLYEDDLKEILTGIRMK